MSYYSSAESAREAHKPGYVRMVIGILFGLVILPCVSLALCVVSYSFYFNGTETFKWLAWVVIVLSTLLAVVIPFYAYGWLHWSFIAFTAHANVMYRIFGKIVGGIGYVLRPLVLLIYGANKKWIYALAIAIPSVICGTVFLLNILDVFHFDYLIKLNEATVSLRKMSLPIVVVCYLNAFLALLTRRCKVCGCMMTVIESTLSDRQLEDHGGYYDSRDMSEHYNVGKYYVCDHCGNIQKGIGFSVQTL